MAIKSTGNGRPDHTKQMSGSKGNVIPQESGSGKPIYRKGGDATEADIDIGTEASPVNIGTGGSEYDSGVKTTGGAAELVMTVLSASSQTFDINIDWLDDNDEKLRTESPAPLQGVTDISDALITVKSDKFRLRVTDASGAATNNVHGSANAH